MSIEKPPYLERGAFLRSPQEETNVCTEYITLEPVCQSPFGNCRISG